MTNINTILKFIPRVLILFLLLTVLRTYNCVTHVTFILSHVFHGFNLSNGSFVPVLVNANYNIPNVVTSEAVRGRQSHHVAVVAAAFVPYKTGIPFVTVVTNTVFNNST